MVRQQVNAISRPIMQNNINSEEIRSLLIPLPPLQMQNEIMHHAESGCEKIRKEQEAAAQIAGEAERSRSQMYDCNVIIIVTLLHIKFFRTRALLRSKLKP